jgi:hypothetical protein
MLRISDVYFAVTIAACDVRLDTRLRRCAGAKADKSKREEVAGKNNEEKESEDGEHVTADRRVQS